MTQVYLVAYESGCLTVPAGLFVNGDSGWLEQYLENWVAEPHVFTFDLELDLQS
jgi:hypothetical protein